MCVCVCLCEAAYLRSDLRSLLGVNCADVFIMFQCVLPVLLLCTDILLQQAQHLTSLLAVLYVISRIIRLSEI